MRPQFVVARRPSATLLRRSDSGEEEEKESCQEGSTKEEECQEEGHEEEGCQEGYQEEGYEEKRYQEEGHQEKRCQAEKEEDRQEDVAPVQYRDAMPHLAQASVLHEPSSRHETTRKSRR